MTGKLGWRHARINTSEGEIGLWVYVEPGCTRFFRYLYSVPPVSLMTHAAHRREARRRRKEARA